MSVKRDQTDPTPKPLGRHPRGAQLEVQLGHRCSNRCVFCVSGAFSEARVAKQLPVEPVLEALEAGAASGATQVTILGGEPTIQRSFMTVVERARELGFAEIVVFTNGVRGRDPDFVRSLVEMGNISWRVSIQGGNREAHEATTRRPGSFARLESLLEQLHQLGQPVTANTCLARTNYRSAPDLPDLVHRFGITQLHLDVIRPESVRFDAGRTSRFGGSSWQQQLRQILPRNAQMAASLATMFERFQELDSGCDLSLGNYPYCLLLPWSHLIHHGGDETVTLTTSRAGGLDRKWNKFAHQSGDATYSEGCVGCVFRPDCRGVPQEYSILFGLDELTPVSVGDLGQLNVDGRHFVRLSLPRIRDAIGGTAPDDWRLQRVIGDLRKCLVEAQWRRPNGERATLLFLPTQAVSSDDVVLVSDAMKVALHNGGGTGASDALLRWLQGRIGVARVEKKPGTLSSRSSQHRGAALVVQGVKRLRRQRTFGDWVYQRSSALRDGSGARVRLEDSTGHKLDLFLEVARGELLLRFQPLGTTPSGVAQSIEEAIRNLVLPRSISKR